MIYVAYWFLAFFSVFLLMPSEKDHNFGEFVLGAICVASLFTLYIWDSWREASTLAGCS